MTAPTIENEIIPATMAEKRDDDSTLPPSEKELDKEVPVLKPKKSGTGNRLLVVLAVLGVFLIVAIVLGVVLPEKSAAASTDRSSALVGGDLAQESSPTTTTTNVNEQEPIEPTAPRGFADQLELQEAATNYLAGTLDATTYGPIEDWDVSSIQDFSYLFYGEDLTGVDLSRWDMSSAVDIEGMFEEAIFTSDLSGWDVSKVTNMAFLFSGVYSFTSDLSNWDVSNVEDFSCTFYHATDFDSDLSGWDVSSAKIMPLMFNGARSFNGNIASWDVSQVSDFEYMFENTTMSQNLCAWGPKMNRTAAAVDLMFNNTNCPTTDTPQLNATVVGPLCHVCM